MVEGEEEEEKELVVDAYDRPSVPRLAGPDKGYCMA